MKRSPLRRKKLMARQRFRRGYNVVALTRSAPLPKRNAKRAAAKLIRNYGPPSRREWVASLPCATCGAPPPSENSHVHATGMGGCGGDLQDVIPQCRPCHEELHAGIKTFLAERGETIEWLEELAAQVAAEWERKAA